MIDSTERRVMGIDRAKIESAYGELRRISDNGGCGKSADQFAEDGTLVNSIIEEPFRGREMQRIFAVWPT